ncbi:MAG: Ig-like domain-containing protein [Eubacteriales bacterium]|nr:Ig-like domain-containing protein [Eubacteriales bacterium]
MKRLASVLLALSLITSTLPAFCEEDIPEEEMQEFIGEYESFDRGEFAVVNGDNTSHKLLQRDTVTKWVFKKENTTGYNMANYPENFLEKDDGVNNTTFLSTGATTMVDGKKSRVYRNFDAPYSQGTVTHEIRLKKPTSGTLRYQLCDTTFSGYNLQSGGKILSQVSIRSTGDMSYNSEWLSALARGNTTAGTTLTAENPWIYLRFVIHMPTRTIDMYYGETLLDMKPWTDSKHTFNFLANGSSGSYTMAQPRLASAGFFADTGSEAYQMACDDVKVYYGDGINPVAYNLDIKGYNIDGYTLTANYKYFANSPESGSVVEWCSADDIYLSQNVTVLKTETSSSDLKSIYTLSANEIGKYVGIRVVPQDVDNAKGDISVATMSDVVREPVTTPTVTLLTPYANTKIPQDYPVYLSADAFCDNTTITKVEFYSDDSLIGVCDEAPYTLKYTDLPVGAHSVYA